ncbi:MAG: hypothetical protein ACI9GH_000120 [Candidatus Paceibacteria bacterium]|jgi:hypothetical protein
MKKIIIILVLFLPINVFANIGFSEVMYDLPGTDSGYEWVEVFNSSDIDFDITEWKLIENSKNHTIKSSDDNLVIKAKTYAIIADNVDKFIENNPEFTGLVFDSAFALNNSGEELSLVDGEGLEISKVLYDPEIGGKGTGSSLQLYGDVWISGIKTPGKENVSTSEVVVEEVYPYTGKEDTTLSSHSSQIDLSGIEDKTELKIGIGRKRLGSTNSPIVFKAVDDVKTRVRYKWSFGDGDDSSGEEVKHTYKYPGKYNVVVNASSLNKQAVSRILVEIVDPSLNFLLVGNVFHIKNDSKYEINIGGYRIEQDKNMFRFPEDTIISANSTIMFDDELFEFEIDFKNPINAYYPNGKFFNILLNN